MKSRALMAFFMLAPAGPLRAGVVEVPVAVEVRPGGGAAGLLARFDLNAADLDWTLQNDADFVNQFVDRNAAQR